jgi:mannonate dehydratase
VDHPMDRLKPGMKVAVHMSPDPSQEDLDFVRQMGVEYAVCRADANRSNADYYASRRELFGEQGIELFGFGIHDRGIEAFKRHIVNLGKAAIPYTTYAHVREHGGGGLWTHFERWAKAVRPVAEEAGVMIGIHADDSAAPELAGVRQSISASLDGYQKAMAIADSANIGICLGTDALSAIEEFGSQQIFKVHVRTVETSADDGCQDTFQAVAALQRLDFRGVMIPDHIPQIGDDPRIGTAHTIACMKALVQRAEAEVGQQRCN